MAWLFELSIECGPNREAAEAIAKFFEDLTLTVSHGVNTTCSFRIACDDEKNWWALIVPWGLSCGGVGKKVQPDGSVRYSDERVFWIESRRKEIVELLFSHLKAAPPFRYATVGLESEFFRTMSELLEDIESVAFEGLVINETLWNNAQRPPAFVPFCHGYFWLSHGPINWK